MILYVVYNCYKEIPHWIIVFKGQANIVQKPRHPGNALALRKTGASPAVKENKGSQPIA